MSVVNKSRQIRQFLLFDHDLILPRFCLIRILSLNGSVVTLPHHLETTIQRHLAHKLQDFEGELVLELLLVRLHLFAGQDTHLGNGLWNLKYYQFVNKQSIDEGLKNHNSGIK